MSLKSIQDCFRIDELSHQTDFEPQVNVSPGDQVPVVINKVTDIKSNPQTSLEMFHFGITPYGARQAEKIITVYNKGINRNRIFRKAIRKQRCLVPANAFVQWQPEANSTPYFIYQKKSQQPFMMAGIWEAQEERETGEQKYNFSILMTKANELLQKAGFEYGPLIFTRTQERRWLRNDLALSDITAMMRPFAVEDFNAYPIVPEIKSTYSNDKSLFKLFGKPIIAEVQYNFSKKMVLHGMGETAARRRRRKEEMDLPKE